MALSQDIVSQFAKLTVQPKEDKGTEVKGTYKLINNVEYVQLDGSDILTPVKSTVVAETGERVNVLIKEHMATVIENITSPSARSKDVSDLADIVDEQGNTIQQMDNTIIQQGNSIIQMNNTINQQQITINQHDTKINQQGDEIVSLNNTVVSQGNQISSMNNTIIQQGDNINSMNNTIIQQGNNINSMNNNIQQHGNRITQNANTIQQQGNTIVQQGNRIDQQDTTIQQMDDTILSHGNLLILYDNKISMLNSDVDINQSAIRILNSGFTIENGVLKGLSQIVIDDLEANTLDAHYAQIDFANINMAAVEKLFSDSGIIENLIVDQGHITGELVGVTLKGDLIEANTLIADKIVVLGDDGLYYKLNMMGQTVSSEQTNKNSLNGSIITAKSITATQISVEDLVAFDATIGGFIIGEHSIHSALKPTIDSTSEGLYMDSEGQLYLGDNNNHIKYYKDENDEYVLDVRLNKLYLGSSSKTADQQMSSMVEISADNLTSTFTSSGGSNLLRNSVGFSMPSSSNLPPSFWTKTGTVNSKAVHEISTSGNGFEIIGNSSLEQQYTTMPGTVYSVSFKYKYSVPQAETPNVSVKIMNGNTTAIEVLHLTSRQNDWVALTSRSSGTEGEKVVPYVSYVSTISDPKFKIEVSTGTFEITDILISQGLSNVWSAYFDEIYGSTHQLDRDGLRVYNNINSYSNATYNNYQIKENNSIVAELNKEHVQSRSGDFSNNIKIGKLKTEMLDEYNIIEYIQEVI